MGFWADVFFSGIQVRVVMEDTSFRHRDRARRPSPSLLRSGVQSSQVGIGNQIQWQNQD